MGQCVGGEGSIGGARSARHGGARRHRRFRHAPTRNQTGLRACRLVTSIRDGDRIRIKRSTGWFRKVTFRLLPALKWSHHFLIASKHFWLTKNTKSLIFRKSNLCDHASAVCLVLDGPSISALNRFFSWTSFPFVFAISACSRVRFAKSASSFFKTPCSFSTSDFSLVCFFWACKKASKI